MGPPERSAQPRAHRHRPLPLSHSPDGCAPGAPSRVEAAIAENSPKTSESAKSLSRAGGQLVRAVPGSLRTSPGELLPAVYALRKAPTRSGALDSISRGGKGVNEISNNVSRYSTLDERIASSLPHAPGGGGLRTWGAGPLPFHCSPTALLTDTQHRRPAHPRPRPRTARHTDAARRGCRGTRRDIPDTTARERHTTRPQSDARNGKSGIV